MNEILKVSLVRSMIGQSKKCRKVLRGMGLTKMNRTVEFLNTPSSKGMIKKVSHLVVVSEESNK